MHSMDSGAPSGSSTGGAACGHLGRSGRTQSRASSAAVAHAAPAEVVSQISDPSGCTLHRGMVVAVMVVTDSSLVA